MKKKIPKTLSVLVFFMLPFLHGCAAGISREDIDRIKGRKVIAAVGAAAPFAVERSYPEDLYGLFRLGYWAASVSEGNRWAAAYALTDPSIKAGQAFLSSLGRIGVEGATFQEVEDDSPGALRKKFGPAGLVLAMKTTRWMLAYVPADPSLYRLVFEARARLVSLEGPETIWKARCRYSGHITESNTLSAFEAGQAALLREKLIEAAESCGSELTEKFFGKGD